MSAVAWPWRGVIAALKAEIVEARQARQRAEHQLRTARVKAQRHAQIIEHAEASGEAKAREVAINHFTELFRESMGPR